MPDLRSALVNDHSIRAQLLTLHPELAADLETLTDVLDGESDLDQQIAAVLRAALEREAMADALGAMIKEMQSRKARLEDGARKLRSLCLSTMQDAGRRRIGGTPAIPDMTVTVSPGKAKVIVTDVDALPKQFYAVEKKPITAEIAKAIDAGETVLGATLGNTQPFITIRRS